MVQCACGRTFRDNARLGRHRAHCQDSRKRTVDLIEQREEAIKRRKTVHDVPIEDTQIPEDAPTAPEEPVIELPPPASRSEIPPTRSGRRRFLPDRFEDFVPSSRTALPYIPELVQNPTPPAGSPSHSLSPVPTPEPVTLTTECNEFGLFREYTTFPTTDPDAEQSLEDVYDVPTALPAPGSSSSWRDSVGIIVDKAREKARDNIYHPFLNSTVYNLMSWFYSGSNQKSVAELDRLVQDVILKDDFDVSHLSKFNATKELNRLDDNDDDTSVFSLEAGWKESSVWIPLPIDGQKKREEEAHMFEVPGVWHRDLLEIIQIALQDTKARLYNLTPFRLFWKPTPNSMPERVVTELYNSEAFLKEHEKLQQQPREEGCDLERVIAAVMLWSDSTHLANFGQASLWPIYLFLGNESKYRRGKPSCFAAHHLAYIPSLPDTILDYYKEHFDSNASRATLTHLKRELMHAIWELILDDKLMEAFEHGFVIRCPDGISRRFYPRFFTYSADYPEKVLLSTIRNLGQCPCPRCTTRRDKINELGTTADRQRRAHERFDDKARQGRINTARKLIFKKGVPVTSTRVDNILKARSEVPTRNAFSKRFNQFGFNFYKMFVPDLLHEFELGVWKSVFKHLIRILHAAGGDLIQELNLRYRQVPTFGKSTIRRFSANASGMKKLAGRDYEDLLQCSMTVFDNLLPNNLHNKIIADMLFILCTWHGYAKLRLHTSSTLESLDETTKALGIILRRFVKDVCSCYATKELPTEEAARTRRRANNIAKGKAPTTTHNKSACASFNMNMYKLHALGDYVTAIRAFGPSDNYSTQLGELEHRRIKRFYPRTNKQRNFTSQIGTHYNRQRILQKIQERVTKKKAEEQAMHLEDIIVPIHENEPLPPLSPDKHHQMSFSRRYPINILRWTDEHHEDPATQNFVVDLKRHLLGRLQGHTFDGDEHNYSMADLASVKIVNNRIFSHQVLRVNYTTYDMRRGCDSINPRTHADIMVLSHEDDERDANIDPHPYWYARVIGVYHAEVRYDHCDTISESSPVQEMEFLWVRWFGRDTSYNAGWKSRRLHRVGFVADEVIDTGEPFQSSGAFGFLDPAEVIRGVHLKPAFAYGKTTELLGPSIVRPRRDKNEDWQYFYVNMFVDRDKFMRFRGGGIGHKAIHDRLVSIDTGILSRDHTDKLLEEGMATNETALDGDEQEVSGEDADEDVESEDEDEDEEEDNEEADEDLEPEDGEEGWEDEYDVLGFAAL